MNEEWKSVAGAGPNSTTNQLCPGPGQSAPVREDSPPEENISVLQTSPVLQGIDASKAEKVQDELLPLWRFTQRRYPLIKMIQNANLENPKSMIFGTCFRHRPPILMNHGQAVRAKLRKIVVLSAHFLSSTNGHSCRAVRKISCSAHWIRSGKSQCPGLTHSTSSKYLKIKMVQAQSRLTWKT